MESVKHLFFDRLVSKLFWVDVQEIFGVKVNDYLSLASKWLCNKRFEVFNVVSYVVIWSIWNNRNPLVFNRKTWLSIKHVWRLILSYLMTSQMPFKNLEWEHVKSYNISLVKKLRSLPSLMPD
jgi:hypothetical protein